MSVVSLQGQLILETTCDIHPCLVSPVTGHGEQYYWTWHPDFFHIIAPELNRLLGSSQHTQSG
jgi:hypothetical protein